MQYNTIIIPCALPDKSLFFIFAHKKNGEIKMAKQQSFADKSKTKKKDSGITVKLIKTLKTEKGTYKFNEKFVKIDDISKVVDIK
ncbi:MAG TPA: hypothetical protein VLN45_06225 [Ignavibacteriaceae bacterium]|nr:hypothetical protein [Ignavibacteriaceae bacterium]